MDVERTVDRMRQAAEFAFLQAEESIIARVWPLRSLDRKTELEAARRWYEYAKGQIDAYEIAIQIVSGKPSALAYYLEELEKWRQEIAAAVDFEEVEGEI